MSLRDLIIVGAGPSGLAAAIAAKRRGLDYQVLEQGLLVNSIHRFPPQMVFFTTPDLLEIGGLPFITPFEKPTRIEALRYYRRVTEAFDLQVSLGEAVVSIAREDGVFVIETRSSSRSVQGVSRAHRGRHVLLAIGYYDEPNRLGIPGEDLPHVHSFYGEPEPYYRQRVVIVGGGNSAAEAALEMYRAGAHVTLVHRWPELKSTIKYWVRPDIENRIKEGAIAARFSACVTEIRPTSVVVSAAFDGRVSSAGGATAPVEVIPADAVFLLVGYHADWALMEQAGIRLTDRRAPVLDPETFETNVPGLFVAGGAVAGMDTGNIFIENGRFHGEKIVDVIAERISRQTDAQDHTRRAR